MTSANIQKSGWTNQSTEDKINVRMCGDNKVKGTYF